MDKLSERLETAATVRLKCVGAEDSPLYQLLAEAAKLARRVEEAPVVPVRISDGYYVINLPYELIGQIGDRFLLVREK